MKINMVSHCCVSQYQVWRCQPDTFNNTLMELLWKK